MSAIDAVVVLLVLAFAVSRFVKFRLPTDSRKRGERGGWQAFRDAMGRKAAEASRPAKPMAARTRPAAAKKVDLAGLSGLEQIKALEPGFDEARFKAATAAMYKQFHKAWNARDEDKLAGLCGPELMDRLRATLQDYRDRGAKPLVMVNKVEVSIGEASVRGRGGVIAAHISAVQADDEVKATRGATQAQPHKVEVTWLLAKALPSDDPSWELQKIIHEGGQA